eukprot:CAMPEP_0179161242 /NCGR_PEP_ID=MMETSP0796-20121207/78914_1 /TAXON_ID=73915 /ORGANISM="Pyrodinium bahamense, Strain pbaha01" /LENGTH=341 /DNA_ID=CAMNT_0020863317 /DNA_START=46 /DNA_END=1071 /DNA_ORIENTATION=+
MAVLDWADDDERDGVWLMTSGCEWVRKPPPLVASKFSAVSANTPSRSRTPSPEFNYYAYQQVRKPPLAGTRSRTPSPEFSYFVPQQVPVAGSRWQTPSPERTYEAMHRDISRTQVILVPIPWPVAMPTPAPTAQQPGTMAAEEAELFAETGEVPRRPAEASGEQDGLRKKERKTRRGKRARHRPRTPSDPVEVKVDSETGDEAETGSRADECGSQVKADSKTGDDGETGSRASDVDGSQVKADSKTGDDGETGSRASDEDGSQAKADSETGDDGENSSEVSDETIPLMPLCMPSAGSVGHPHACGRACKYLSRKGCKDGASCTRCHLCKWSDKKCRFKDAF